MLHFPQLLLQQGLCLLLLLQVLRVVVAVAAA
jgi:hypothetical protein